MAHDIDLSNNRANIAYIAEPPWHGLGQKINPDDPLEKWSAAAGLNWEVFDSPLYYINKKAIATDIKRKVLYRSDTGNTLSVVSENYKIVQPAEILDFFNELINNFGFKMNTAGVLQEGCKVWALAKTGKEFTIFDDDLIQGYLLLTTSYDTSLSTTAIFTTIRVVCNNTLNLALFDHSNNLAAPVKVSHRKIFKEQDVKLKLGIINDTWCYFADKSTKLANIQLDSKKTDELLVKILGDKQNQPIREQKKAAAIIKIKELYSGQARGSNLKSSNNTAWGLFNAITEYSDHHKNYKNHSSRLNNLWFGDSARLKRKSWKEFVKLVS